MKHRFEQPLFLFLFHLLWTGFAFLLFLDGTLYGENLPNQKEFHRLAVQKAREKQYQESEQLFRQAIEADSKNQVLLCDFAKLFADQNRLGDAEVILKNALLLEPSHRRVLYNLGRIIALQPNRQMEGVRYLKWALGEHDAYRELAKIYRLQGQQGQAEFAEQQAALTSQDSSASMSVSSVTVPMDEKTKKELLDQVRLELMRLETKEIAVQRDKKEQNSGLPIHDLTPQNTAMVPKTDTFVTKPSFRTAPSVQLNLPQKPEESAAAPKLETVSPGVSQESPVYTAVKKLAQSVPETRAFENSFSEPQQEKQAREDIPVWSEPVETKTPQVTSNRIENVNPPINDRTLPITAPKEQAVLAPKTELVQPQDDDTPSPIHVTPNIIPREKIRNSEQVNTIYSSQNAVRNWVEEPVKKNPANPVLVLHDPFRAALEDMTSEKKPAIPPVPEELPPSEKNLGYQFTSAQAPNVLKFGVFSEEKKPEVQKSNVAKLEPPTDPLAPLTTLKFGPTQNAAVYVQKAKPAPQLLPPASENKQKKIEIVYQEDPVPQPHSAAVSDNSGSITVANGQDFATFVPKTPPKGLSIDSNEELKAVFVEPKLRRIESVPKRIVQNDTVTAVQKLPTDNVEVKSVEPEYFPLSIRSVEQSPPTVSEQDIQMNFFGKVAGKLLEPVDAPVPVKAESIPLVKPEPESAGFATARTSVRTEDVIKPEAESIGFATSRKKVYAPLNPQDNWEDEPISTETATAAEEGGFARTGQFVQE